MKVAAVIPGAGQGLRFSGDSSGLNRHDKKKQFLQLGDKPLIFTTLEPFLQSTIITSVIVVVPEDRIDWINNQVKTGLFNKPVYVVLGGDTRQRSVRNGVEVAASQHDVVVVHDAVRPFFKEVWISETVNLCEKFDGAIVAIKAKDTLKKVNDGVVNSTLEREGIWQAQTPQTFKTDVLLAAIESADEKGIIGTDEAQLVEMNGGRVAIVEGSILNIKITTQEDWELAKAIWKERLNIVALS